MRGLRSLDRSERFLFYTGLVMAASEIWKQWTLTFVLGGGSYNWWYFPFQLCSVPMYLLLLLPVVHASRLRRIFLTFLMDFSLLSGIGAFLDTSGMHYPLPALTCHSYLWHLLLIAVGIFCGLSAISDHTWHGFSSSVILFAVLCSAATVINLTIGRTHDIDMFYISPYYQMSQVIISDLTRGFPNPVRILCYLAVIVFGAFLLHLFWQHLFLVRNRKNNRQRYPCSKCSRNRLPKIFKFFKKICKKNNYMI